jgi:hypothetical protein
MYVRTSKALLQIQYRKKKQRHFKKMREWNAIIHHEPAWSGE